MRLAHRLRRSINNARYRFVPTEDLIARVGESAGDRARQALIEILKERLAHQDGSLAGVDWSGLSFRKLTLSTSQLLRAQFTNAGLTGAYFGYCDLREADFAGADLREGNFRESDLTGASFEGANLSGANFARANLRGSVFRAADLTGANFWGADLRGADFADARLSGCCLTAALIDEATRLPASPDCEADGATAKLASDQE